MAVRAAAFFALPEVQILRAGDHDMIVNDILGSFYQVFADLLHSGNLVILHDDVFAPGEEVVIHNLPAGAQSQE